MLFPGTPLVFFGADNKEVPALHGTLGNSGLPKETALPELPLEELKARLAWLPADAAVIFLLYLQSPTGETYTSARIAREIAAMSSVPVMGAYDTYFGTGLLGVCVATFEEEGVAVGTLARRVLSGERPEAMILSDGTGRTTNLDIEKKEPEKKQSLSCHRHRAAFRQGLADKRITSKRREGLAAFPRGIRQKVRDTPRRNVRNARNRRRVRYR